MTENDHPHPRTFRLHRLALGQESIAGTQDASTVLSTRLNGLETQAELFPQQFWVDQQYLAGASPSSISFRLVAATMSSRMPVAASVCIVLMTLQSMNGMPLPQLDISGQLVFDQLLHLATFSDDPNPAVTRILFTGGVWRHKLFDLDV